MRNWTTLENVGKIMKTYGALRKTRTKGQGHENVSQSSNEVRRSKSTKKITKALHKPKVTFVVVPTTFYGKFGSSYYQHSFHKQLCLHNVSIHVNFHQIGS
jgi:hypothetical protein